MTEREPQRTTPQNTSARFKTARRWARIVMGFTVILIGLVLSIPGIPGPGILIIVGGLAILATEYVWARRYLNRIKEGGDKLSGFFRKKKPPDDPHKP
ncbi:MAG TPA: PGPGW domain-containing protein [bacterium]